MLYNQIITGVARHDSGAAGLGSLPHLGDEVLDQLGLWGFLHVRRLAMLIFCFQDRHFPGFPNPGGSDGRARWDRH